MYIEILTPEDKLFEGTASSAKFPGSSGSFEVLENHAPLISSLDDGIVTVRSQKGELNFRVDGGVVEVLKNKVTVLLEKAIEI
ncbi:MAG: ATP synthase F1 subunit epsilon [Cytophagales bacterium]